MGARILVVDDDVDVLAIIGKVLRQRGHEVTSTNSGGDALCLMAERPYDLVLLDLLMPGRDGNDVLAELRTWQPPAVVPPVIVMTGTVVADAGLLGTLVRRVLKKPFELEELFGAVDGVVADHPPAAPPAEGGC